ncbi:MAG: M20/M25/M40 family metallo-hydrolase [Gemmatimonadetes bacterium]|jgi:acetylornithine deacetylase/succinyl-diaminopimelate desuccinylase-like protein|nr:M20/M25/M40 family metallo-hydrolase [Gemmatimonadota bacterium]
MMRHTIKYGPKILTALWMFLFLPSADLKGQSFELEPHQQLARDILQEIIEINTVDSAGTTKAAKALERRLLEAGFSDEDVRVVGPTQKKMNLVARLRGRDTGRPAILLLAHLDVVEALRSDWNMDPWKMIEQDGHFYGRGVIDDKDEAAIYTANLIRYKQEGFVPDRDIIIALTADEEGGEHNGVQWLLENHRELIDAEYALNEGGGGEIKDGKHRLNAVQASEKVYQNFNLRTVNPGGHSSLPRDDNAIYELAEALVRISEYQFPIELNEVTEAYFRGTAEVEGGSVAMNINTMLADPTNELAVARIQSEPGWNARLRTTCVATRLDGGHANNALPQTAEAIVNCRILPTHNPQDVLSSLRRVVGTQVEVTPMGQANPSPPSPLRTSVLEPIQQITEEMWPGVPIVPIMATGATDGLYLRRAGIPTYGVSGIFADVDDNRAHGQDERILIKSFFEGQEFLFRLVKALSSPAGVS